MKKWFLNTLLFSSILLSVGCSDLLPLNDSDPESIEKGLPGVWHNTHISMSEAKYAVKDDATGHTHEVSIPGHSFNVDKKSDYYCILKFNDSDIIPLSGGKAVKAQLVKEYPYTITNDSIIDTSLYSPRYSESICYISNIKKGSFDFVVEQKGQPLLEENADSICLSSTITISFSRLR